MSGPTASAATSHRRQRQPPARSARVEADRLHLSLDEGEVVLEVQAPHATHALYRAGEQVHGEAPTSPQPQWGWTSPTYARLEPALTWMTVGQVGLPVQVRSLWTLGTGHWPADGFGWTGWGDDRRLTSVTFEDERLAL